MATGDTTFGPDGQPEYDPYTGKPVADQRPGGNPAPYYDPYTGKPNTSTDSTAPMQAWSNLRRPTSGYYGGEQGFADTEAQRLGAAANAANDRPGAHIDTNNYYSDRNLELTSRNAQRLGMMHYLDLANGQGSLVDTQMRQAVAQNNAQQASFAASARGSGGNLIAAQQASSNAAANMSGQAAGQAAVARNAQQIGALQGYGQAAGNLRAQDLQRSGMSAEQGYRQAQIEQQQHALNDARNLGYENLRKGVYEDQAQFGQTAEQMNSGIYNTNADLALQQRMADQQQQNRIVAGGMAAVGGLAQTGAAAGQNNSNPNTYSDVRLKKDIQPGAAQTEAALDEMHGVTPVAPSRPAAPPGHAAPPKRAPPHRETTSREDLIAERNYAAQSAKANYQKWLDTQAQLDQERAPQFTTLPQGAKLPAKAPPPVQYVHVGGPRVPQPQSAKPVHHPVGPTATAEEIARPILYPSGHVLPYYGPTPTAEEIAAQYGVTGRPKGPATIMGAPGSEKILGVEPGTQLLNPQGRPNYGAGASPLGFIQRGEADQYLANATPQETPDNLPVMSDKRLKTGTHFGDRTVEDTLDHLRPYSYSYKDPSLGAGQRVGIMAQDLEKSPMGLASVIETPRGKAIDINRGLSLSLAANADLHERVKRLEAKRGMR